MYIEVDKEAVYIIKFQFYGSIQLNINMSHLMLSISGTNNCRL